MRILFTGGSSFTGYWFIQELVKRGHAVTAIFRKSPDAYVGVRKKRVEMVKTLCKTIFECDLGSEHFLRCIESEGHLDLFWDLFCHHAADATDYKSEKFDVAAALANNTKNLPAILSALKRRGCDQVLLTGSYFEPREGFRGAVSPYALSKTLTYQMFRYYAEKLEVRLANFVVPNPFGPFEEERFTSYLIRSWFRGERPKVAYPLYIRDNIHIDLLAKAYLAFAESLSQATQFDHFYPSGYVESQGSFAQRFANEMASRLPLSCSYELADQTEFLEPPTRFNTDTLEPKKYGWDERSAWDRLAAYYLEAANVTNSPPHSLMK